MTHGEVLRLELLPSGSSAPRANRVSASLAQLVRSLDRAMLTRQHQIECVVAAALTEGLGDPDLLSGIPCPALAARYARHLLHSNERYSLLALVWRSGQMSTVHGHKTWCAFGVYRGSLTESLFRHASDRLQLNGCRQYYPGEVSHSPAGSGSIHRLANLGVETAISIHVYGVPFGHLAEGVNLVWAD